MDTLVEDAIMGYDVCRVAGHEQAFDAGAQGADLFLQIAAAYSRHNYIGHQKMDLPFVFLCDFNCLERTAGTQNGIAQTFYQDLGHQEK